ncbi:MAG: hypothetical protein ABIB79_02575 [archaeon]
MTLKILNKNEKAEIISKIKSQFGIQEVPGLIIRIGTERLFIFQGDLSPKEIKELEDNRIPIERIGVYFGKEQNNMIRLSIEGVHLLKDQINKNIFELDDEQAEQWIKGQELLKEDIIKNKRVVSDKDSNKLSSGGLSDFARSPQHKDERGQERKGFSGDVGKTSDLRAGFRGFLVMKYKDDFIGTGKASEMKIGNYIPKQRRLKEKG